MKIAVLSDTHGNYPALEATLDHIDRWGPDITVFNGDIVNRGPRSRACWELLRERKDAPHWHIINGNHEDYVTRWVHETPDFRSGRSQIFRSSFFTFNQMKGWIAELCDLPRQVELRGPDGRVLRMTHGTMRGNDEGIYADTPDEVLMGQIAPAPAVFCTGHTHRPFVRRLNGSLVVNSGSAGTSFDQDPRISYAQLSWIGGQWQAEIIRLDYDRVRARKEFEASDFWHEGGPLVEIFFQEWLQARPMVNRWSAQYEDAVIAGDIDLQTSVDDFLRGER